MTTVPEAGGGVEADVSIRRAQPDDLRAMAALLGELFAIETDFTIDLGKQYAGLKLLYTEESSDLLVAKQRNRVIGMITLQRVVSTAEGGYAGVIEDLVVRSDCRGMGIGSKLLDHAVAIAKARGFVRLQLAADVTNMPALEFYTARGFRQSRMQLCYLTGFDIA